jgi:hypothetical protein
VAAYSSASIRALYFHGNSNTEAATLFLDRPIGSAAIAEVAFPHQKTSREKRHSVFVVVVSPVVVI